MHGILFEELVVFVTLTSVPCAHMHVTIPILFYIHMEYSKVPVCVSVLSTSYIFKTGSLL